MSSKSVAVITLGDLPADGPCSGKTCVLPIPAREDSDFHTAVTSRRAGIVHHMIAANRDTQQIPDHPIGLKVLGSYHDIVLFVKLDHHRMGAASHASILNLIFLGLQHWRK